MLLVNRFGILRAFLLLRQAEEYFGGCMAKIIEFYIPQSLRNVSKWLPPNERGKLLEFPVAVRKSSWQDAGTSCRRRIVRAEHAVQSISLRHRSCYGQRGREVCTLLCTQALQHTLQC